MVSCPLFVQISLWIFLLTWSDLASILKLRNASIIRLLGGQANVLHSFSRIQRYRRNLSL